MRYEHAGRFWTITRVGSVLTIISGKIGNKGRTVVKHHPNEGAALSAHDQLVLEKQREGYRIAADAPVKAPAAEAPPDDRGAGLEEAIAANPDDASAFAVYGDWLQKHDDPRGELIALQHATGPKAAAAVGKHIAQHAARLLGPLAHLVRDVRDPNAAPFFWKHGFIRRAELGSQKEFALDQVVAELLAHPSAKFLVELAIRAFDRKEALAIIDHVRTTAPPTVRELDLFARANLDRIDRTLWLALPRLERLTITARAFELEGFAIPALVRGKFVATNMSSSAVQSIAIAPWPVLERLEIRFCGVRGTTEADFHDLRPLLLRTDMPKLTHLKLRGCAFAGAVARTLAASPLSRQLHVIDFSAGDFSPQDLQTLAAHASNFPNLRELWLPYTYVNSSVEKMLAPVAKRVLPDSKGPIDSVDYDLAGETVPRGEPRYGGIRE
ncbi:MAG: TIGR02996 domain-containing protein [Myxococcota bacterium]|nr:TIGR02996 domain-containing protein [Myxococcota bacterium]